MSNPLVSCLCCTYGRPQLLGEAIRCFIDQDYDNKELIVLNDQEGVDLKLHPSIPDNIHIYNHPKRFDSLGQKRNYIKSMAHGEYCCIWDDDDLYTKWRLRSSVEMIKGSKFDIVKPRCAILSVNNNDYSIASNLFHSQACITKEYISRKEYPNKSVGEDMDFENGALIGSLDVLPFYIYRWGNCGLREGIHHLSGIANDKESWNKSLFFPPYNSMNGDILIEPVFQRDYWSDVCNFMRDSGSCYLSEWQKMMK